MNTNNPNKLQAKILVEEFSAEESDGVFTIISTEDTFAFHGPKICLKSNPKYWFYDQDFKEISFCCRTQ